VILTLLIGLVLTGATVALVARAVAMPRLEAIARLGQIEAYGFAAEQTTMQPDAVEREGSLDKLALAVGRIVAGRWKAFDEAEIRRALMTAGLYTTSPMTFLGYRALAGVTVPLAMVWYLTATGANAMMLVVGAMFGVFAGWTLPMTIVSRRARKRFATIERDLPELIDLLVVTVEAGLGFNGSLQITSEKMRGALGDELRLTLQEQRMGLSMTQALTNLLARCDTPSMRSFVRSVLQGETLGVSIGQIMRSLALEMRKRRRASAEERAQKAPLKILFPLVFLIFPSMFIVLLFPAVYAFMTSLGGK
jgi:tight adherence protein C